MEDYESDYSTSGEEQKTSKFNSTLAILFRIDALWKDAHTHSRAGKLINWNWDLDRVWRELAADTKEEQEKEFKKIDNEVNTMIGSLAKKTEKDNINNHRADLYKKLIEKEIFLRKLQNKQGKGVAYEDKLDDYLD